MTNLLFFVYMGEYWQYYLLGIVLLPGLILASWAQAKTISTYKKYRNLCGRIRRMLIASCKTIKDK